MDTKSRILKAISEGHTSGAEEVAKATGLSITTISKATEEMEETAAKKMDDKNCLILNILQKDCRTSLTDIAAEVGLSVDSVKKRIEKMENIFFYPKIQIRPRQFGFDHVVDVKIKLSNHAENEKMKFIDFLKQNDRVTEIFEISGEYNLSIVIIARNSADLQKVTSNIKLKFGHLIDSWMESALLKAHKFEQYDVRKMIE